MRIITTTTTTTTTNKTSSFHQGDIQQQEKEQEQARKEQVGGEDDINSSLGTSLHPTTEDAEKVRLSCTPHTDSGILTILHQDSTGGLEVRNAQGKWVPAPYLPGSIVVNIGDLMAKVSGGRFVATMHRVRKPEQRSSRSHSQGEQDDRMGRLSVPFFFEPGERCRVRDVDGTGEVVYGEHVREKMKGWVEFI